MKDWTMQDAADDTAFVDASRLAKIDTDAMLSRAKTDTGRIRLLGQAFHLWLRASEKGTDRRLARFEAIEDRLAVLEGQQADSNTAASGPAAASIAKAISQHTQVRSGTRTKRRAKNLA